MLDRQAYTITQIHSTQCTTQVLPCGYFPWSKHGLSHYTADDKHAISSRFLTNSIFCMHQSHTTFPTFCGHQRKLFFKYNLNIIAINKLINDVFTKFTCMHQCQNTSSYCICGFVVACSCYTDKKKRFLCYSCQ